MKITDFRRALLGRLAEATLDHPMALAGKDLRAARWLVEQGLARKTDNGFYTVTVAASGPRRAQLAEPRVRAGRGRWDFWFGAGEATVLLDESDARDPIFRWTATSASGESFGESYYWDLATLAAWSATAIHELPPRVEFENGELDALIAKAASTVDAAVAIFRRLLEQRSGFRWSVRRGKGIHREKILIKASNSRLRGSSMTGHDAALLAALLGLRTAINRRHGATIESRLGARADALRAISGRVSEELRR